MPSKGTKRTESAEKLASLPADEFGLLGFGRDRAMTSVIASADQPG